LYQNVIIIRQGIPVKKLLATTLLLILSGCASIDYQPFEGRADAVWEGQGGSKLVVNGIDFWDNGSPPRKFKVVGYATGAVGAGIGADGIIRDAVASKVRALNGSAAILVTGNTSSLGFVQAAPNTWMTARTRELKYAVVRYIN
jgi:hypothetical protein